MLPPVPLPLDKRAYDRALACVHCGLCLPACPTYLKTAHEADSPRGRIQLMRGMADATVSPTPDVLNHLDLCLDCRACETACPSGVVYHELLEETRAVLYETGRGVKRPLSDRLVQSFVLRIMTHPRRLKLALLPIRLLQRLGLLRLMRKLKLSRFLPASCQKMERLLPESGPLWPAPPAPRTRAGGVSALITALQCTGNHRASRPKATVGLLSGCVGGVLFPDLTKKTIELLAAAGADVICPKTQTCCGALHHHNGQRHRAAAFARQNLDAFDNVDFIVTPIAGCGAMLREYDTLLRDDPAYSTRATHFSSRLRDISQLLLDLGLPEMKHPQNFTATYHDACHLAHAQKITSEPRRLLEKIPGLQLIPLAESDTCCGAAGIYNLTHPAMAADLAARKLKNITATGAAICIAANPGCAMHLHAESAGKLRVLHPVDLLHAAIFG